MDQQLPLFTSVSSVLPTKPVNVASIPQRSPFRYPGGKTWLIPFVRKWLSQYDNELIEFFEPFAGGAIVSLTVAFEKLARYITLVELDIDVIAVWQTIFSDEAVWLANRILKFDLNDKTVDEELSTSPNSIKERAFQTILKNRVNHGGILAPGAGRIKYGENGKGMLSRWYPQTLYNRILEIGNIRDRISCVHGDGFECISTYSKRDNIIFFIVRP
jgi:DNA adenine methylase